MKQKQINSLTEQFLTLHEEENRKRLSVFNKIQKMEQTIKLKLQKNETHTQLPPARVSRKN